ncbi:MAG: ABC transporter ATP-binding protein [Gammaproteobacteria bacterium]|nr:ABC transporter ATP-binding protein [Gammaproteobacteria bacterium]
METAESVETPSPVLEFIDGSKRREQGGVVFELHVPELRLYKGQFVAVVGDSGCGKSTLLDMLALVSRPSGCEKFSYFESAETEPLRQTDIKSLWDREDERGLAALRRSRLGYVLQTGGLLPFLTVFQNIHLPSKINGYHNEAEIRTLAKRFGVEGALEKKPQYLSGGQRQRVAILRALHHRPKIILADEPTAAVDKKRAHNIVEDFNILARENGTTIIMVTHDRDLVKPFAHATCTFDVTNVSETLTRSVCRLLN